MLIQDVESVTDLIEAAMAAYANLDKFSNLDSDDLKVLLKDRGKFTDSQAEEFFT